VTPRPQQKERENIERKHADEMLSALLIEAFRGAFLWPNKKLLHEVWHEAYHIAGSTSLLFRLVLNMSLQTDITISPVGSADVVTWG
jgi:hypothetical protein